MSPDILFPEVPGSKFHLTFRSRKFREANFTLHSVPGSSGKQISPYIPFPEVPGSEFHLTFRSRKFREANFTLHSVPGSSGKQMSPYSLFPEVPGSHCTLSVGRQTLRKAVQFTAGQGSNAQNHAAYSITVDFFLPLSRYGGNEI
ncbi:MAG: hypothetical protein LBL07_18540 [Tannerella sp.]|nr:hypothetical protein [Tannerella sp.]